jgi:hypothetical protein
MGKEHNSFILKSPIAVLMDRANSAWVQISKQFFAVLVQKKVAPFDATFCDSSLLV